MKVQRNSREKNPESTTISYEEVRKMIKDESKKRNKVTYNKLLKELDTRFTPDDFLPEFVLFESRYAVGGEKRKYIGEEKPKFKQILRFKRYYKGKRGRKPKKPNTKPYISLLEDFPKFAFLLHQSIRGGDHPLRYPYLGLEVIPQNLPTYVMRERAKRKPQGGGTEARKGDIIFVSKERIPTFLVNKKNLGTSLDILEKIEISTHKAMYPSKTPWGEPIIY